MTLVIMAAGMGSRFGGLKQIEPVHENGEFILDYSIYDALQSGFDKVVFIIKEENYDIFRNTIGKRIEDVIKVEYVFQNNKNIPSWVNLPIDRVKPLGTGHAILCCKDTVNESFVTINADDFYGRDAFLVAANYLKEVHDNYEFAMVGYSASNTLTENGSVKRGICHGDNGYLTKIIESSVQRIGDNIIAKPLDGSNEMIIDDNTLVSMNMFIFTPEIFNILEEDFDKFFKDNQDNLLTSEYLIPDVICQNLDNGVVKVKILKTTAKWQGITYREDKDNLVNGINKLVKARKYPDNLWKR